MTEGGPPASPRVVVGLDFGTNFSGFAYAHVTDPENIYTFYDYPMASGEKPRNSTLTASYYKPLAGAETSLGADSNRTWKLQSWGYPASLEYERDIVAHRWSNGVEGNMISRLKLCGSQGTSQHGVAAPDPLAPSVGVYLTRFKLHLASRSNEAFAAAPLPRGLTVVQVITDYLRGLGGLALKTLQDKYGSTLTFDKVQWCVAVPSFWDDSAKATMRTCMVSTGLVSVRHQVTVVLEPEAASFHCLRTMCEVVLETGTKLLVAVMGSETSDIVVQEVVEPNSGTVKEVTMSSRGLCGGKYVDSRFMEFLEGKVGKACLSECLSKHRYVYRQLLRTWKIMKCTFTGDEDSTTIFLPIKLAVECETSDMESGHSGNTDFKELQISSEEMQSIFDPVVQQNVELIQQQIVEAGGKVLVLMMVGKFTHSPYLLRRIRETFKAMAENIICPPNSGTAIVQGAIALALNRRAVVSRICRPPAEKKQRDSLLEKLRSTYSPNNSTNGREVNLDEWIQPPELAGPPPPPQPSTSRSSQEFPRRSPDSSSNSINVSQVKSFRSSESSEQLPTRTPERSHESPECSSTPPFPERSPAEKPWISLSTSTPQLGSDSGIIEDFVKKYTWGQVLSMTNNLLKTIGKGGFGAVYLGKLDNEKEVAVKILDANSQQGLSEFLNEVNLLKRVSHVHLVRLLGYCLEKEHVLIYEYAEEGSIWDHLQVGAKFLDWETRLKVALESACGLEYLHTGCHPRIIHRDIKSQNILLTKRMVAKVADFGLSKLGADQDNVSKTHLTTMVKGTLGYLDPEYLRTGQLTEKSDVYSFGVVLLEIITGRKPIQNTDRKRFIGDWVEDLYNSNNYNSSRLKNVVDPSLGNNYNTKAMKLVVNIAKGCLQPHGMDRPEMTEVVIILRKAQMTEHDGKKSSKWLPFL